MLPLTIVVAILVDIMVGIVAAIPVTLAMVTLAAIIVVAILIGVAAIIIAAATTLTGITRTITIVRIIIGLIVHRIMGLITRLRRSIS
jgi:hypothetical protein